tara:strand:+ start:452 stop:2572 length:2121 start_codon:yes stop_codon:yes gene_type:complete
MKSLNIVRGDSKNKPISSGLLADYFETVKNEFEGTLYIGYPIIGTAEGGFQIDALLITKECGVVVFSIEEGTNLNHNYKDIQDENCTKIISKLIQHKELTKKRNLVVDINALTYVPACQGFEERDEDYPVAFSNSDLKSYLEKLSWSTPEYFEQLMSVLQSITTIRRNKSRKYVLKPDSRGAKLRKLEESIANLDSQQSSAVIETVEGVQRIRGLAGSGKTIILALKVAYLHAKNPNWKIAVTFNTRSLKGQLRKYITQFSYEHINEEPNWDNIDIIHAWGTTNSEGVYYNLCRDHNIEYFDFFSAKAITSNNGKEFDTICKKAINEIKNFQSKYDLVVIDEAQDFSKEFLQICYRITTKPHRLVYAYDELQNLNSTVMSSPEEIFGVDAVGKPLVSLKNEEGSPKEDIILYKCYRNSLEILTTAHALGFGIYRSELVQMFESSSLWNDIGYEVIDGDFSEGETVHLKRNNNTSPEFLSSHSSTDDIVSFLSFSSNEEQVDYVVSQIIKNIEEDELHPDDIMVINPNPLTTKKVVGMFREKLFNHNINSSIAGVTSSPDIFYDGESITFTGIYRAKGNEAPMVYIINSQYCYDGLELSKKRNILFTAMTRSKAWVRVCGYGEDMEGLKKEFELVKNNDFSLKFKYPTKDERRHMNIVNRDMSIQEKDNINKHKINAVSLLEDLKTGKIQKEDLSNELLLELKALIL